MAVAKACWLALGLLTVPAVAGNLAVDRKAAFLQACLRDATVPAGRREALCTCIRNAFAYGTQTRFGQSDLLSLPEVVWEAPDRRLPADTLGDEVRQVRQACLLAGQPARRG